MEPRQRAPTRPFGEVSIASLPTYETSSVPSHGAEIETDVRIDMYSTMWRAHVFETRAYELFVTGLAKGTTPLGPGQEAIAAGAA